MRRRRTGSPAPRAVADLLIALRAVGATDVSPPTCAECGKQLRTFHREDAVLLAVSSMRRISGSGPTDVASVKLPEVGIKWLPE